MKIFICADIHGNLRALDAVLEIYKREFPCRFLFLGDCIGYGPYPDVCLARILNLPQLDLVMGNHEYTFLNKQEMVYLNPIAAEALNWSEQLLRGRYNRLIVERFKMIIETKDYLAVHASPVDPDQWPYVYTTVEADEIFYSRDFSVCFYGHTHIPVLFTYKYGALDLEEGVTVSLDPEDRYIINPGSVGQPRDLDPRAACAIYDTDAGTITLFRCEYDVEAAAEEFYSKGLPRYLGERLLDGR